MDDAGIPSKIASTVVGMIDSTFAVASGIVTEPKSLSSLPRMITDTKEQLSTNLTRIECIDRVMDAVWMTSEDYTIQVIRGRIKSLATSIEILANYVKKTAKSAEDYEFAQSASKIRKKGNPNNKTWVLSEQEKDHIEDSLAKCQESTRELLEYCKIGRKLAAGEELPLFEEPKIDEHNSEASSWRDWWVDVAFLKRRLDLTNGGVKLRAKNHGVEPVLTPEQTKKMGIKRRRLFYRFGDFFPPDQK